MRGKCYRRVGRPDPITSFSVSYNSNVPQTPQIVISSVSWPSSEYGTLAQLYIEMIRPDSVSHTRVLALGAFVSASIVLSEWTNAEPALGSANGTWQIRLAPATATSPPSEWSSFQSFTVS